MRMVSRRVGAVGLAVGLTAAIGVSAQPAHADVTATPRSGYTWAWSDGGTSTKRTFSEAIYRTAAQLPKLVVTASCARGASAGQQVRLQYRHTNGRFRAADSVRVSNCNGEYRLAFQPYTASGAWAKGTFLYRLIIPGGGGYKYFRITYVPGRG
jgi:hypothetical protein